MKASRITLPAVFALLASVMACAQEQEAVQKLKDQIIELQNRGALGFREFYLCASVAGYGSFLPLEKTEVAVGSELLIYYEPVNVYTRRDKGQYEVWYTQDIVLLAQNGQVLYEEPEVLNFRYTSRSPVFGLYATNSLNLADLPPGEYVYKAVLRDKFKESSAEHTLAFTVVK